jgi:signal transduction histidine kinase
VQDLSLHILDIAENSINAGSTRIEVRIVTDEKADLLELHIADDGRGMDEEELKKARDPFYTSKPGKRIGLGIPLLAQAAREGGGEFSIQSTAGGGTVLKARFTMSHPDRKPLGDIAGTMRLLQVTHPEIEFIFEHQTTKEESRHETETRRSR